MRSKPLRLQPKVLMTLGNVVLASTKCGHATYALTAPARIALLKI